MDKKGQWNAGSAFDLNAPSDLIDDKMAKNMAEDIRRQLGPNGLSLHKPVVSGPGVGPGGIPISSGRSKQYGIAGGSPQMRKRSNDGALE